MSERGSKGDGGDVLFLEGLSTTFWHRPEWRDKCCTEHSPHSLGAGIPWCKQTHTPPIITPCPSISLSLYASLWRLTHSGCGKVDMSPCGCVFRCDCGPWSWTSAQHPESVAGKEQVRALWRGPWLLSMGLKHWGPPAIETKKEEQKVSKKTRKGKKAKQWWRRKWWLHCPAERHGAFVSREVWSNRSLYRWLR